jgi:hypothetical protein
VTGTLPIANGGTGLTSTPANGALDIGNGTGFTRTTLTAGTNVTITNSSGGITIAASGGGSSQWTTTGANIYYNTGNVSIGNTSPQTSFQVSGTGTASGGNAATSGYAALMLSDTTNNETYIHSVRPGVGWNNLNFGALTYTWRTNGGNVAMTFNSSNNLQLLNSLSVGNATPTTSGAGITFPATQSASSNANTLDDYEEGTWTPTLTTSGTNFSSVTYVVQTGSYTKIGNKVYVEILLGWSALSGSPTGDLVVAGLPFTVDSSAVNATFATMCYFMVFPTLSPAATYATMKVGGGTTQCIISASGNNTDWTPLAANAQTTTGSHYIRASGSYTV